MTSLRSAPNSPTVQMNGTVGVEQRDEEGSVVEVTTTFTAIGDAGDVIDTSDVGYTVSAEGYDEATNSVLADTREIESFNVRHLITYQGDLIYDGRIGMKDLLLLMLASVTLVAALPMMLMPTMMASSIWKIYPSLMLIGVEQLQVCISARVISSSLVLIRSVWMSLSQGRPALEFEQLCLSEFLERDEPMGEHELNLLLTWMIRCNWLLLFLESKIRLNLTLKSSQIPSSSELNAFISICYNSADLNSFNHDHSFRSFKVFSLALARVFFDSVRRTVTGLIASFSGLPAISSYLFV